MREAISRRQYLQLFAFVLVSLGVSLALRDRAPLGRSVADNPTAQAALNDEMSPSQQVRSPTLTLVVFTDYQCPACKLSDPAMNAAVAEDGHVRVIYRDWPIFGERSEQAARVAIASNRQNIYPDVHRRLMSERRMLDPEVLRLAVLGAGGSWRRLQTDLRTHERAINEQLNRTSKDAFTLGIPGTPAYLVGTILITGAMDEAAFKKAFALARKTKLP